MSASKLPGIYVSVGPKQCVRYFPEALWSASRATWFRLGEDVVAVQGDGISHIYPEHNQHLLSHAAHTDLQSQNGHLVRPSVDVKEANSSCLYK